MKNILIAILITFLAFAVLWCARSYSGRPIETTDLLVVTDINGQEYLKRWDDVYTFITDNSHAYYEIDSTNTFFTRDTAGIYSNPGIYWSPYVVSGFSVSRDTLDQSFITFTNTRSLLFDIILSGSYSAIKETLGLRTTFALLKNGVIMTNGTCSDSTADSTKTGEIYMRSISTLAKNDILELQVKAGQDSTKINITELTLDIKKRY